MTYDEILEQLEYIFKNNTIIEQHEEWFKQLIKTLFEQLEALDKEDDDDNKTQKELKDDFEFNINGFDMMSIPYNITAMSLVCTKCGKTISTHEVLNYSNKCILCCDRDTKNENGETLDWSDCKVDVLRV